MGESKMTLKQLIQSFNNGEIKADEAQWFSANHETDIKSPIWIPYAELKLYAEDYTKQLKKWWPPKNQNDDTKN